MKFKITNISGKARTGILKTAHGNVKTPFLMPVATKGSVKYISNPELYKMGFECIISNSFILSLKPGTELIKEKGGLHKFISWEKGIFTDSGGFQVLSDKFRLKLSDEGVLFRNPFDGKKVLFSPEYATKNQNDLGSDVAMCLDDVPKAGESVERLKEAVERTSAWAKRCFYAHENKNQMLFGICQGGVNKKLREKSAKEICAIDFDGIAIGGLAIGEPPKEMFKAVEYALPFIPEEKPRYLMGVGSEKEIRKAISMGIDAFDSCFPARTGRHGKVFTKKGHLNITTSAFRKDSEPLEKDCDCFVCTNYTRSFIHHLFVTGEESGRRFVSHHNLHFMQKMIESIRKEIEEASFKE